MNPLTALLFPDTAPPAATLGGLFLFCDALRHYLPVEKNGEEPQAAPDLFTEQGLCQGYPPLPLGAELPRFRRLLADMQAQRQEFLARLASPPSSGHGRRSAPSREESSVGCLVASLTGKENKAAPGEESEETLWRARLVLALAEQLLEEQREIDQRLADIAGQEETLRALIQGEEEEADEDNEAMTGLSSPALAQGLPPQLFHLRLRAWARLHLAAPQTDAGVVLPITTEPEAAALFGEYQEKLSGKPPLELCRLALPEVAAETILARRDGFRQRLGSELEKVAALLQKGNVPAASTFDTLQTAWAAALDEFFPEAGCSRSLVLSSLAGSDFNEVLRRSAGLATPAPAAGPILFAAVL